MATSLRTSKSAMSSSDSLTPKTHSSVFQLAADAVSDTATRMLN